jgi:flagellar capping protein FliD
LTTFQLNNYTKEELRNDNTVLKFDYKTLIPSTTFQGADYTWNPHKKTFSTVSVNELGNGLRFTLSETFTSKTLQVMELMEKNGQRLTSYETPILYERKQLN